MPNPQPYDTRLDAGGSQAPISRTHPFGTQELQPSFQAPNPESGQLQSRLTPEISFPDLIHILSSTSKLPGSHQDHQNSLSSPMGPTVQGSLSPDLTQTSCPHKTGAPRSVRKHPSPMLGVPCLLFSRAGCGIDQPLPLTRTLQDRLSGRQGPRSRSCSHSRHRQLKGPSPGSLGH